MERLIEASQELQYMFQILEIKMVFGSSTSTRSARSEFVYNIPNSFELGEICTYRVFTLSEGNERLSEFKDSRVVALIESICQFTPHSSYCIKKNDVAFNFRRNRM